MVGLEDITRGMMLTGLVPDRIAVVVAVERVSHDVFNVIYKCEGNLGERQVFRAEEASLSVAEKNLPWTFDATSEDFKRALEALRIRLGCRFDPMMAIHSSDVMPLPHQISAVYECMLPISPLRYVLADDEQVEGPYYVKDWVDHEPEPGTASVNYQLDYLLSKAKRPEEIA